MQYDICLKCDSRAALTTALTPYSLTTTDESGVAVLLTVSHDHALLYAGRVVSTPAETDQDGHITTEATYWPGEYAILRAENVTLDQIAGATMAGVEVVDLPAGCPTFGGEWWERPAKSSEAEALEEARAAKIAAAAAACDAVLDPLGREYGAWEKQTWDQQAFEAAALMADPTLETNTSAGDKIPCIRSMAAARGMTLAELAQRILFNRERWLQISGAVIGQRQAIYDRVQAVTTVGEVKAITVAISLPG